MAELWRAAVMNEPTLFEEVTGLTVDPGHRPKREYRTGRQRRDAGMQRVLENEADEFKNVARAAIEYLADKGQPFTSDDVRDLVVVKPHHENCWGAAVAAAVKAGVIVRVGYRQSERPEANRRVIAVYEGAK